MTCACKESTVVQVYNRVVLVVEDACVGCLRERDKEREREREREREIEKNITAPQRCRDACAERRDVRVTRAQTSTGLYPQVVMEERKDRSRQWNRGRTSACEKY